MPDTTNGIILVADGTGVSDVTTTIQHYLDSAAQVGKPLLIPYTDSYYKISNRLIVNGSVMGIGGMPKIVQSSSEVNRQGLLLDNGMSGWIYNLHIVGPYDSTAAKPSTEYGHNIAIRVAQNVTIMNCILETALGDGIGNDTNGKSFNILITNNDILDSYRNGIAITRIDDHWAIINNKIEYYSTYVSNIDIEPGGETSYISNIEVAYNDLISPKPKDRSEGHFYDCVVKFASHADSTPGENFFVHHNWGKWGRGVKFLNIGAYSNGTIYWKSVEAFTNIAGNTVPGPGAKMVSIPTDLTSTPVSKTAFNLTWTASTADAGLKGYLIYQRDSLLGITDGTSYDVTGLNCQFSYEMTIKAYDNEGNTSLSTEVLVAVPIDCSGGFNMLINSGIESPLSEGWNLDWGGGFGRTDTIARTGTYSMIVGPEDGGRAQYLQGFKLDSSYTIQVWSKAFGMEENKSNFGVQVKDSSDAILFTESALFPLDSLVWNKSYLTFTVPSNAKTVAIFVSREGSSNQNIILTDDWSVVLAIPVTGVSLNKSTLTLAEGLVSTLTPVFSPANAIIQDVTWATSDSTFAVVTQNGFVKAMKEGSAVITVSTADGGFTATCDITITKPSGNLILNPGFEKGIATGWTKNWGGTTTLITDDVHSGKNALSAGPGGGERAQTHGLYLLPGATYTLSVWGKLVGSEIDTTLSGISIDFKDKSGVRMFITPSAKITDSLTWKRYHVTFTVPMEANIGDVFISQNNGNNKNFIVLTDDCALISGWEPMSFVISSDASASSIRLIPGGLIPNFSPDVNTYNVTVQEGTTSVFVKASSTDPGATIVGSGNIDVSNGSASVEIVITAEDGTTTQTYTIEIAVESSVGIMDKEATQLPLYPNPVSAGEIFHMEGVQGGESISILDMTGRVVFTRKLQGADHELIQLNEQITMGTYIIKVSGRSGVHTQLLIVK